MDSARFRHSAKNLSGVAQGHHHRGDLQALRAGSGLGQARAGARWPGRSLPELPILTCSCPEHPHGCIPGSSNREAQID